MLSAQTSVWDGTIPQANASYTFSGGDGTQFTPYIIASAADLAQLSANVTTGENLYENQYFIQTVDLDLGGVFNPSDSSWSGHLWQPIGVSTSSINPNIFKGHYDGNFRNIYNLYVNRVGRLGVFSQISGTILQPASLRNMRVMSGEIIQQGSFTCHSAGVCGFAEYAIIDNCINYASVFCEWVAGGVIGGAQTNTIITNCVNYGDVSCGDGKWAGGVVGSSQGISISYCVNKGTVSGRQSVGGVIGYLEYNTPVVEYCINQGVVFGDTLVGNVLGTQRVFRGTTIGSINNCYYDYTLNPYSGNGFDIDSNYIFPVSPQYLVDGSMYESIAGEGFTDEYWCFECESTPMPIVIYQLTINDLGDLMAFRDAVNNGTSATYKSVPNRDGFKGECIILNSDLDLSLIQSWTPIGSVTAPFKGSFIGRQNKISSLQVSNQDNAGLFGVVEDEAIISRLHILSGSISNATNAGGIVGKLNNATVKNCSNGATINNSRVCGGIAGKIDGSSSLKSCLNIATISSNQEYASIGGLAGLVSQSSSLNMHQCMNAGLLFSEADSAKLAGLVLSENGVQQLMVQGSLNVGQILTKATNLKYALVESATNVQISDSYFDKQLFVESNSMSAKSTNELTAGNRLSNSELWNSKSWKYKNQAYPIPAALQEVASATIASSVLMLNDNPYEYYDSVTSNINLLSENNIVWKDNYSQTFLNSGNIALNQFSYCDTIWVSASDNDSYKEFVLLKAVQPVVTILLDTIEALCENSIIIPFVQTTLPAEFIGEWQLSNDGFVTHVQYQSTPLDYSYNGFKFRYYTTDGELEYYSNEVTITIIEPVEVSIGQLEAVCDFASLVLPEATISDERYSQNDLNWFVVFTDDSYMYYNGQPLSGENLKLMAVLITDCGEVRSNEVDIRFKQTAQIANLGLIPSVEEGDVLTLIEPAVTPFDTEVLYSEWQISNDAFVSYEIYNFEPLSANYDNWEVRFAVYTDCDVVYSNSQVITFNTLPIVGSIETPALICDNEVLPLYAPDVVAANLTDEGWEISRDNSFSMPIRLSLNEISNAIFDGYYCRYFAENELGVTYSNAVQLAMDIASSNFEQTNSNTLAFKWNGSYQSIAWYQDGELLKNEKKSVLYQNHGLSGEYRVEVKLMDGRVISSCIYNTYQYSEPFTIVIYPNPA